MRAPHIGILLPYLGNPFWHDKEAAYRQLAPVFGFELEVRAPDHAEPEAQAQLLELFLEEPCDAWIINPYTPSNLDAVVRAARGKTLFDVGAKMASQELVDNCPWYIPVPTVDFAAQGTLAGIWLAEQLTVGDQVLLIPGISGMPNSDGRIKGAEAALQAAGIGTQQSAPCNFKAAPTEEVIQPLLNTGQLPRAIFCANDVMALAVSEQLVKAGVKDQVLVAGVDGIQPARTALHDGLLDATVAFYSRDVVQRVLEAVTDYLAHGTRPSGTPIQSHLLTR